MSSQFFYNFFEFTLSIFSEYSTILIIAFALITTIFSICTFISDVFLLFYLSIFVLFWCYVFFVIDLSLIPLLILFLYISAILILLISALIIVQKGSSKLFFNLMKSRISVYYWLVGACTVIFIYFLCPLNHQTNKLESWCVVEVNSVLNHYLFFTSELNIFIQLIVNFWLVLILIGVILLSGILVVALIFKND